MMNSLTCSEYDPNNPGNPFKDTYGNNPNKPNNPDKDSNNSKNHISSPYLEETAHQPSPRNRSNSHSSSQSYGNSLKK